MTSLAGLSPQETSRYLPVKHRQERNSCKRQSPRSGLRQGPAYSPAYPKPAGSQARISCRVTALPDITSIRPAITRTSRAWRCKRCASHALSGTMTQQPLPGFRRWTLPLASQRARMLEQTSNIVGSPCLGGGVRPISRVSYVASTRPVPLFFQCLAGWTPHKFRAT